MKVAFASDLHLEFGDIELKNTENADVLILAGDIILAEFLHDHPLDVNLKIEDIEGNKKKLAYRFRDFFKRISQEFKHIIVIAGNHEFYHGRWYASLKHLEKEYREFDNIHFLERDCFSLGDVNFIGGTLWSDMNNRDPLTMYGIVSEMNDFSFIRNDHQEFKKVLPHDMVMRHKTTLDYFSITLNPRYSNVIISHHAPSFHSIGDEHRGQYVSNGGYCSSLERFVFDHPSIKYWIHGHIHEEFDYVIGTTRVLCNPRGYAGKQELADTFQLKHFII